VLLLPVGDDPRDVGILTAMMNDSPAASIAFRFASEIIPASATTVTSRNR
jgi:hypothetical protein